jgi:hypothetical protein
MVEILLTIIFSATKFAMTFPLVIWQFEFSFLETILWTNVGGIIGIFFFAFLSEKLIAWWKRNFRKSSRSADKIQDNKKVFTKRNRRIVRIKSQYGLIGIAITTPVLLSIPVGVFLVIRYYRNSKRKFPYLIVSNLLWSVIYTAFYMFWDGLLFS